MKLDDRRHLERLQQDFGRIAPLLAQMAARVVQDGVSRYPIFVACRTAVEIGVPVVMADAVGLYWNFRLTTLEELFRRKLITEDRLPDFQARYQEAERQACVLLVPPSMDTPRFVFVPFITPIEN